MTGGAIAGIRSVDIGTPMLSSVAEFYRSIWQLRQIEATPHYALFRGTSRYHHIFRLHQAPVSCIASVTFDVLDEAGVDALYLNICAAGVDLLEQPERLSVPGGGYGFGCKDPEGRNLRFLCGAGDHTDGPDVPDRVRKITHLNLNTADYHATLSFFTEVLQLNVIDQSKYTFLHANSPDHHCLVLAPGPAPTLNHIAFEMPDVDSVMRGAGRMRRNGYPIEWGVGRHGPGNNVFAYFAGPDELPIEYTADILQIDSSYVPRGPDFWQFPNGQTDQWGITEPHSPRWKRIQRAVHFTADGVSR